MKDKAAKSFRKVKFTALSKELGGILEDVFSGSRLFPSGRYKALPQIPKEGRGLRALPELWRMIEQRSTYLSAPTMMAHMDVAPHPAAALTSALVSALSNNLLFRELSPFASDVEEQLISMFARGFGFGGSSAGTFVSGGSVANLSCLFAAVGGFASQHPRHEFHVFCPASVHLSVTKSAAVLGIPLSQVVKVACDDGGRMSANELGKKLADLPKTGKPIVVAVAGTTIHGSMDPLSEIADCCQQRGAWLHIDAIYGSALVVSHQHKNLLKGSDRADSIAIGPQKWMYVPRLSAGILFREREIFEKRLGTTLPYSLTRMPHRGQWGLQTSRPADALLLWAVLQTVGTQALGEVVDNGIAMTTLFHRMLNASEKLTPTHVPDLNLQTFKLRKPDAGGIAITAAHQRLTKDNKAWFSVSKWRDDVLLRAVILAPDTNETHLQAAIKGVESAIK